jgi:hypothetical protein
MLTRTLSKIEPSVAARLNLAHPLARGLAGCWLLNEGAGRVVHDVTGHHHDGIFAGAPLWVPSGCSHAIEFDGYDDWISMGDCLNLGTGDVTLFALVKYSAATQPDEWGGLHFGAIAGRGYLDGSGQGYGLSINSSNEIYWQIRNQGDSLSISSDVALNDGQYHLAIGVCDRDNVTGMRLYIDGVQQTVVADPTPFNGNDLVGSRVFAIGSRQEETAGIWFWDFQGFIAAVYVWKRVLTEGEIRQLQCNPFALFARQSAVSGALQVLRNFAGAIAASATMAGTLSVQHAAAGAPFSAMLQKQPFWLREALFHGRTATAFKLGTALTGGRFWTRRQGCTVVYRGTAPAQVDLSSVLYVTDLAAKELCLPACLSHAAGGTYHYLVRRYNGCGYQEQTTQAVVVMRIAPNGALDPSAPNAVMALKGEQTASLLRLVWFYCPLNQTTAPKWFNIYWDNGCGQIDYENPVAVVPYRARTFYCHHSEIPAAGRYLFAVRAEGATHKESGVSAQVICQMNDLPPETAIVLVAETT